jgi:hypothetical protein
MNEGFKQKLEEALFNLVDLLAVQRDYLSDLPERTALGLRCGLASKRREAPEHATKG